MLHVVVKNGKQQTEDGAAAAAAAPLPVVFCDVFARTVCAQSGEWWDMVNHRQIYANVHFKDASNVDI